MERTLLFFQPLKIHDTICKICACLIEEEISRFSFEKSKSVHQPAIGSASYSTIRNNVVCQTAVTTALTSMRAQLRDDQPRLRISQKTYRLGHPDVVLKECARAARWL